jgi:hypothetical protein
MITALSGSNLNAPRIPECQMVEWNEGSCRVVFSYARQGNAISGHFACQKQSIRRLKDAINDFCEWAFWAYDWCRMVFAVTARSSIERLIRKCGFMYLANTNEYRIWMRVRP